MTITDQIFAGERPLYESTDLTIQNITVEMGESALKECRNIVARQCRFEGMYIFWEGENITCEDSTFCDSSRASMWYGDHYRFRRCQIASVKPFREIDDLTVEQCTIRGGVESFWKCRDVHIADTELLDAEYCFLHAEDAAIIRLRETGKYAFQYSRNIRIDHSTFYTKDAFWESDDCTICDTELRGEYLGWYSRNLRLVRCHISGTQPLCYCQNLVLDHCTFAEDADRALERSTYTIL